MSRSPTAADPLPDLDELKRRRELLLSLVTNPETIVRLVEAASRRELTWAECEDAWSAFRGREATTPDAPLRRGACGAATALYLHVPVCEARCTYCDCSTRRMSSTDELDRVAAALVFELERYRDVLGGHELRAMAVGGGTPSLLPEQRVEEIVHAALSVFRPGPDFYFSVEMSPHTATPSKLQTWRRCGATRVSFGVQSMTDAVLRRIARGYQTAEQVIRAVEHARAAGFASINLDLVAGLPGETEEGFLRSLEALLALDPETVTIYRWIVNDKSLYFAQHGPATEADVERQDRQLAAAETFLRSGPAWASERFVGRPHSNQMYVAHVGHDEDAVDIYERMRSDGASIIGVGYGALSHVAASLTYELSTRWQDYLAWPSGGTSPTLYGTPYPPGFDMAAHWASWMDARGGASRAEFVQRFGAAPEEVFPAEIAFLESNGWIEVSDTGYRVTRPLDRDEMAVASGILLSTASLERARELGTGQEQTTPPGPEKAAPSGAPAAPRDPASDGGWQDAPETIRVTFRPRKAPRADLVFFVGRPGPEDAAWLRVGDVGLSHLPFPSTPASLRVAETMQRTLRAVPEVPTIDTWPTWRRALLASARATGALRRFRIAVTRIGPPPERLPIAPRKPSGS